MSVFRHDWEALAKANSQEYMKEVHDERRKKNPKKVKKTKKFKVSRHAPPWGYGSVFLTEMWSI